MFKKSIPFLLLLTFIVLVGKSLHWARDGFSIRRVAVSLPEEPDAPSFDPESIAALSQDYRYLSRGHQSYAFLSEDGQYVLKLPRYDLYRQPFWLRSCRLCFLDSYRNDFTADKEKRLQFLLNSFRIAFEELKEETSLLFVHLGLTNHLHKTIRIKDRFGCICSIDLDRSGFVLQKRQELMMPVFERALRSGEREQAQAILKAFIELNAVRARKGIYNKDPSFVRNFGLERSGKEWRCIQIDVGSFYRPEQGNFSVSFLKTIGHVQDWLAQIDPEMEAWLAVHAGEIVQRESE
jgi:hypothetical protein